VTQLADPGLVGPATEPDVDGRADLHDVTAVERAGGLNRRDVITERVEPVVEPDDLTASRARAGSRDDGQAVVHHEDVFDEHAIRMIVERIEFDDRPPMLAEDADVGVPLRECLLDVNVLPGEVGEFTVGQTRARSTHEDHALVARR